MTASDGSGKNSPYTSALLAYISEPDITIEQMFKKVRTQVINKSNGQQQPWESTNMTGDFYFAGGMVNQGNTDAVKLISNNALNNADGTNRSMPEKSIAVLPFENYTGNPENEPFVYGQWDQLSTELQSISSWLVKSRSALKYKGSDLSIPQIANELGVDYIVEGSVLGSGDTVRILIKLYQAFPDEKSLMAQTYDAYLKGMASWRRLGQKDLEVAKNYFEFAVEKDSLFALAYQGVASVWLAQAQMGFISPEVAGPKSLEFLMKSMELDSTCAEAHYMMALFNTWVVWDWKTGESEFKKAIALNPNFPDAHAYYAHLLFTLKRLSEGKIQAELSIKLDPFNSLMRSLYGVCLVFMEKYDDACEACREALKTSPNDPVALAGLYGAAYLAGRYSEAVEPLKLFYNGNTELAAAVDNGYAKAGHIGAFNSAARTLEKQTKNTYINPFFIADLYSLTGEDEKAIEWFEKGFEVHDQNMPYITAPYYQRLCKYPRFTDILKKMNLPY